jgi:membrane fusion protein (multidrug efflux system)
MSDAMIPPDPSSNNPADETPKPSEEYAFPALHADEPAPETPAASTPPPAPATPPPPNPNHSQGKLAQWIFKNKSLAIVVVLVVFVAAMWGVKKIRAKSDAAAVEQEQNTSAPDEIPVNAVEVKLGRFQDTINAVGSLKGEAEIELRFQVDGRIEELNIVEGAKVRKGEIIGRLSGQDSMLKVQRAKNELEQTEKLYQLGGVSKTKLDEARINLDVAQTEMDKTRLVATRDGILGDKGADIGEFVTPQRKIATLVAIKNVVVKVGIIEKQVDKVYPGQKMLVTVDAYPGNVFEGTIQSISPIITGESKTFEITARIPNPDSLLLPGMFARTKVITYEADDALSVPNDALIKTSGGFQVFVINKDNVAEARDVQVGYVSTENTQIQSGLNPGDVVIVQRPPELKAGSKVKIIEVQK